MPFEINFSFKTIHSTSDFSLKCRRTANYANTWEC